MRLTIPFYVLWFEYNKDDLDRVSEICYTDRNNTQQYYRYTYTAEGFVHTVESTEAGRMYCYTYNTKGQPIGTQQYHDLVEYEYFYDDKGGQAQDVLSEFDVSGVGGATANYTYTYDAVGNPLTYGLYTMTWSGRQLMRMTA